MGYRYYSNKKSTVEDYPKTLSTSFLNKYQYFIEGQRREGTITWSRNGTPIGNIGIDVSVSGTRGTLRVHFTQTDCQTQEKKDFDYQIALFATKCNYGGVRWWFIDPCGSRLIRCTKLYLQNNGYFTSRKTLNLSYAKRNEPKIYRYFKLIFTDNMEADRLHASIKYPYRNGKPTRKMKKYLKMTYSPFSLEERLQRMDEAMMR